MWCLHSALVRKLLCLIDVKYFLLISRLCVNSVCMFIWERYTSLRPWRHPMASTDNAISYRIYPFIDRQPVPDTICISDSLARAPGIPQNNQWATAQGSRSLTVQGVTEHCNVLQYRIWITWLPFSECPIWFWLVEPKPARLTIFTLYEVIGRMAPNVEPKSILLCYNEWWPFYTKIL